MNLWVASGRLSPPAEHPEQHRHGTADDAPGTGADPARPLFLAGLPLPPSFEVADSDFVIACLLLHLRERPADPLHVPADLVDEFAGGLLLRHYIPPLESVCTGGGYALLDGIRMRARAG
jgi:hypothetical protein